MKSAAAVLPLNGIHNNMFDTQRDILPWASLTIPVMIITIRARTLATVETTWRIAPHFTFIQFTKVSKPS